MMNNKITERISRYVLVFLAIICAFFISSCQQGSTYRALSKEDRGNTKYKGHYKIGKEYSIKDKTYKPQEVVNFTQVGMASWYGGKDGSHGNKTANGDKYNKNMLTAAHRTLQLPSLVKVTNMENNKSVIVLVNDRGPFCKGRIIDISERAAEIIGMKMKGTSKVKIEYLHSDSKKFLKDVGLQKKHGSTSSRKVTNAKCTVNCHIKLANMRHKIKIDKR